MPCRHIVQWCHSVNWLSLYTNGKVHVHVHVHGNLIIMCICICMYTWYSWKFSPGKNFLFSSPALMQNFYPANVLSHIHDYIRAYGDLCHRGESLFYWRFLYKCEGSWAGQNLSSKVLSVQCYSIPVYIVLHDAVLWSQCCTIYTHRSHSGNKLVFTTTIQHFSTWNICEFTYHNWKSGISFCFSCCWLRFVSIIILWLGIPCLQYRLCSMGVNWCRSLHVPP